MISASVTFYFQTTDTIFDADDTTEEEDITAKNCAMEATTKSFDLPIIDLLMCEEHANQVQQFASRIYEMKMSDENRWDVIQHFALRLVGRHRYDKSSEDTSSSSETSDDMVLCDVKNCAMEATTKSFDHQMCKEHTRQNKMVLLLQGNSHYV